MRGIQNTIVYLESHQIYNYIGSLGILVNIIIDKVTKTDFIQRGLSTWNFNYTQIKNGSLGNDAIFEDVNMLKTLHDIYKVNSSFVEFIGVDYLTQVNRILNLVQFYVS